MWSIKSDVMMKLALNIISNILQSVNSKLSTLKSFFFVGHFIIACLMLTLLPTSLVFGQTATQDFLTAGTGQTWICPPGVTSVQVEAWGSGGGGGSSANSTGAGGSGGGGGAYSRSIISVIPGNTYYIQVGAAGTGAPASSTPAGNGGDAWFNSSNTAPTSIAGVLAKGGAGPLANNNNGEPGGLGGAAASGWGTIKFSGGDGGAANNSGGGGGGSSAGTGANGIVGGAGAGGAGGIAPAGGGNGGAGAASGNATSGFAPGGGGGGSDDVAAAVGASGAIGKVVITYPTITISSYSASPICQGASFTITGSNFTGATSVTVNGVSCSFVVTNSTLLTVTMAPTATTGLVAVSNSIGTVTGSSISVDVNTVTAPSTTPTLCINTPLLADITHTTTGATGIGTPTGLPSGVTAVWATNTITISGTPTTSGIFNYSIPLTGGCGSVNATGTITVSISSASAASYSPTLCIGTNLSPTITHTTTGATGIGSPTGLPAGVSAAWASNTITISGTPTQSGTFNYTIPLTGTCGSSNATGTINVIASLATNTIASAIAGNICSSVGIPITVTLNPSSLSSGTYSITYDLLNATNGVVSGGLSASMIYNQGAGTGTFTTAVSAAVKVRITAIAIGTCSSLITPNVVTNQIVNQVPSTSGANGGFTLSGSTTDSNNPFGSTITAVAKGAGFSVGTYRITYTINTVPVTVPINSSAIVQFTASRTCH